MGTFVLGMAIFFVSSEWLISTRVAPHSGEGAYREHLHTSDKAYAVFADSHGANGLRPTKQLENLSQQGDNIITVLEKALFVAQRGRLKGVVLQADPHHFAIYRLNRDQADLRDDLFAPEEPWLTFLRPQYRRYLLNYWKGFIFEQHFGLRKTAPRSPADTGIKQLTDQAPDQVRAASSARASLHRPVPNIAETKAARLYHQTISKLLALGVKVCLVSFPVSSHYLESSKSDASYLNAMNFFARLGQDYPVTYLDRRSHFEDQYFSDPDHLNPTGAERMTAQTLQDCFGIQE